MQRPLLSVLMLVWASALLTGCGKGGTARPPNDPAPTGGQIVAQGSFDASAQGKTVTGSATVYRLSDSFGIPTGEYVIRLSEFQAPAESGLQVIVVANGSPVLSLALRAPSGNMNYSVSYGGSGLPTWNKVIIHSSPANLDYATANLVASQIITPQGSDISF